MVHIDVSNVVCEMDDVMDKTVLFISYDGMTDPLGQSQVLPYIIGLSKRGYKFHLMSFEKPDKFRKHRKFIQRLCDENGVVWHPQDYVHKGGALGTVGLVRRMNKVTNYLHAIHHFDILHCRSYIPALVGLRMKRKGVKFVFDMRGFWPDERVDGGLWNLKNPIFNIIYKFFKRKEKKFIKSADAIVSLTEAGKNEILSWPEASLIKREITIIPCCVDLELFNKESVQNENLAKLRSELNISEDEYILGYVGSIGTWYLLDEMLSYFKVLKSEKPNARFLFVSGEEPDTILSKAKELGIDQSSIIITSCLHHLVPLHIALFNESVFFIRPSYSKKASSPTKQGEIMAMGIPLTCNSGVGDTDEIVKKYKAGSVVEQLNVEGYKNAIGKNFDQESTIKGANEFFSLEAGVNAFEKVYKSLYE